MSDNELATLGGVSLSADENGRYLIESIPPMDVQAFCAFLDAMAKSLENAIEKQSSISD